MQQLAANQIAVAGEGKSLMNRSACSLLPSIRSSGSWPEAFCRATTMGLLILLASVASFGQADQGTITGQVLDPSGAVVAKAAVKLTNIDTGLVLQAHTDSSGVYTFSPVKIGNYQISATAAGFATTTQQNLHLDVQQRLAVNIQLRTGAATETVEVTAAPPLMQSEEASVGQVMSARVINETPLNGRNWVYIAQLTSGVAPANGARGQGKGDFNANGQRAEQNNFILDGVDNNTNVVDFLNGASFVVRPPPDALSEFKVQTGDYSAEFGHSAGAVVNATLKSGTNQVHGSLWEYARNNAFDARDWDALSVPNYHQNQFGATLGLPIFKNKLFFFGDVEANRVIFQETQTETVPTAKMRTGDFSELLDTSLTGAAKPIQLYEPNSANPNQPLGSACGNPNNVMCASEIDSVAQAILNMYPLPNTGGGVVNNNYVAERSAVDNTFQFDGRLDWIMSPKDQAFSRFSYLNEPQNHPGPLGPILDGGNFGDDGRIIDNGQNFAFSETHIFSNTLTNEFRGGYNYGHFGLFQSNIDTNVSQGLDLGGIPFGNLNGGLPYVNISGISHFGSPQFYVSNEYENVFQVLDNVSKIRGNHAIKIGINFQHIRFSTEQPTQARGTYTFNGLYTSDPANADPNTLNSGYGVADFLANQMNSAALSNLFNTDDVRWDRSIYAQDDWKIKPRLTLNLGLRYEYPQSYRDLYGHQAVYYPTGPLFPGSGSAVYLIPTQSQSTPLGPVFPALLAADNIILKYVSNPYLIGQDKYNFAPRLGFAYRVSERLVARGGFGIFYGGVESTGYYPNLGENFPFEFDSNFPAPNCAANNCPSNGFALETGFTNAINAGLLNSISTPALRGSDPKVKTPYSQQYNFSLEYGITNNLAATIGYVGSASRHLQVFPDPNSALELLPVGANISPARPFPDFGGTAYTSYSGISNYNSLQAKLERRFANGLSFLASYTYSHALDDAPTPLGSTGDPGYRNTNLVPIRDDYADSPFDVRHRVTFNGNYELPFGRGRKFANQSGLFDYIAGGWSSSLTFRAQTGEPFTVTSDITTANGASAFPFLVSDPLKGGGSPDPSNPGVTCPAKVHTLANWYNPCAFANPPAGSTIISPVVGSAAALPYLGTHRDQIYGPGYQRIDMSLFKDFHLRHERVLQFRADIFNLFNTPSWGNPSGGTNVTAAGGDATNDSRGGQISSPRTFQNLTPDARFFQFALKLSF